MIDFGWVDRRAAGGPPGRPAHDLNELYCRTKDAQAEAERHGFVGMAAALAEMAAKLALEPGVDPATVRALASPGPASSGAAPASEGLADPIRVITHLTSA